MRVLLVSNLFPPDVLGGYELLADDVRRALETRRHEVHVLTSGEGPREGDDPRVERRLRLVRPFGAPMGLERVRHALAAFDQGRITEEVVARVRPDAILLFSLRRLGLHVPRTLRRLGLRSVSCLNDDWLLAHRPGPGRGLRGLVGRLIERGPLAARTWRGVLLDEVLAPSQHTLDELRDAGAPIAHGQAVPQGVDRAVFPPRPRRAVPREPRLLFVGRLHPSKGADQAIDAVAILRERGIDARLSLVGTGTDEPRLRALVAARRLEPRVTFVGFVAREHLHEVHAAHDVFLFPSAWNEPAGLTYLEAMSSGMPVIARATGGARELLADGENALLVADAEGFARAVERLVREPALLPKLLEGGERTLEKASLSGYVTAIEEALRRVAR